MNDMITMGIYACSYNTIKFLQNLDALSAMNDTYPYEVPAQKNLPDVTGDNRNFTSSFNLTFSLLRTLVR